MCKHPLDSLLIGIRKALERCYKGSPIRRSSCFGMRTESPCPRLLRVGTSTEGPGGSKDARETIGLSTQLRIATWNCAGLSNMHCVRPTPDSLFDDVPDLYSRKAIELTADREKWKHLRPQNVVNLFMGKCSKMSYHGINQRTKAHSHAIY